MRHVCVTYGKRMAFRHTPEVDLDRTEALEERIAHLTRAVEDLSDMVARQGTELDRLTRLTRLLAEREAQREEAGPDVPPANQKPPHW